MATDKPAAVLTEAQREWLRGNSEPAKERNMRSRVYSRIRAAINEDAELIAEGLEQGKIDPEPIADSFRYEELFHGIRAAVAAMYILGQQPYGFDNRNAIKSGIERGGKNHMENLEQRAEDDPDSLSFGDWVTLKDHSPKVAERAYRQVKQKTNLGDPFMSQEGLDDMVEFEDNED